MPLKSASYGKKMLAQVGIVYTGTAARAGLALVISVLVARWFGPELFGIYNFFLATMIIFQALFGESFDAGVVRYYAFHEHSDDRAASAVVGNFLLLRFVMAVPVTLAGIALSPWIANRFFQEDAYTLPMQLGLLGAFVFAMLSFFLALLQARDRFLQRSLIFVLINLLRLLSLPVLFIFGWLSIPVLIGSHLLWLAVGSGIACWLVWQVLRKARLDMGVFRELIKFSKWSASAHFLFVFSNSLAIPVLAYLASAKMAGIYAAGTSLVLVIEMAIGAIMTVQLPAFSRESDPDALRQHIKRSFTLYAGTALLCSPLFLFATPLTQLVYGPEYLESARVFQILLIGVIASLLSHPLSQVFYAVNRPQLATLVTFVSTLVWIGTAVFLIPDHAASGAAMSTLLSRIVGAVMIIYMVWSILWLKPDRQ